MTRGAAVVAGCVILLLGCSDGGGAEVASLASTATPAVTSANDQAGIDTEAVLLEFARCMRDNGLPDFEDPVVGTDGNPRFGAGGGAGAITGVDPETRRAAFEVCGPILDDARLGVERPDRSEFEDRLLAFAECLRTEGIEVDDPDFAGEGGPFGGSLDREDPEVAAAVEACAHELPGDGGRRAGPAGG